MDSRRRSSHSDRHLIAEQPGMAILLSGLVLSFLLGYTTKSLLSPSRVSARIEKAASHIHKDVKVRFSQAQVSLSDGILPRFAVVISGVQMESAQKCWGAPTLEVDELRLPLSFWNLIRGRGPIQNIEANTVKLTLREDFQDCTQTQVKEEPKAPAPMVSLTPSNQSQKYQNDISGVRIQKLQIVSNKYPQFSPELLSFAVKVRSFEPRVIELTAKTHLLKDAQVGDYLSHANIYMEYKDTPEETLQSHFFGNWREGHYSIIANYTLDERLLAVETDLKHIPLSQILAILQKYDLVSKELNGRQVWMSSKARLVAPVDKIRTSPLEIRDLRLEGDLGEMKADRVDITSLEPLKYSPIVIDVKKMDIGKLLTLLNRPKNTSMLGELGIFTGRAEIVSDREMRMSGEHTGLEFVFSNKGQRELQTIERMVGDIQLHGDNWNFNVKRVEPRGGTFIGDVKMKADRDFRDVDIKARIEEISLSPAVQKLMTNDGEIGLVSLDADIKLTRGQMSYMKGLARVDSMDVEGLNFTKTKTAIDWAQGEVILNTQIQSLQVDADSPGAEILKQVTDPSWWAADKSLTLTGLSGQFQSRALQALAWKNFQGSAGKSGRLLTDGSWDEQGRLKGSVLLREGKTHQKWTIEGNRENPVFVKESLRLMRK